MAVTQNQPPGTPRARIPGPRQPPTPYPRTPAGLWKRCLDIGPALWTPTAVVTYATGGRHATADPDPARRLPRARPLRAPGVRTARPRPGHACGPRPLPGRRRPGRARRLDDGVPAHPPFAVDVRGHRTHRGGREARRADVPAAPAHPDPRTTGRSGARRDARVRLRGPGERGPRLRRGRVPAGRRPVHAPGDRDPARGAHPVRTRPVDRGHRRGPAGAAPPRRALPPHRPTAGACLGASLLHAPWDSTHGIALWPVARLTRAGLDGTRFAPGGLPRPTGGQDHLLTPLSVGGLFLVAIVGPVRARSPAHRDAAWRNTP